MFSKLSRGPLKSAWANRQLIYTIFILLTGFMAFGFDGSVVGGIMALPPFIQAMAGPRAVVLSSTDVSVIVGVPAVGAVAGLAVLPSISDRYGRRMALWVASIALTLGSIIQTASVNVGMFVVGRALGYMGGYMYIVLSSAFLSEVAPKKYRGTCIGLSIVLINSAAILSAGIILGTSTMPTKAAYEIPLAFQILFPLTIAVGISFISDAPTYFILKDEDEKAKESLRSVRGGYTDEEVDEEFQELLSQTRAQHNNKDAQWIELFRGCNFRRTMLACMIPTFQQFSGIAFATNFATIFLKQIGGSQNTFVLTVGLCALALGGAIAGFPLIDTLGRRPFAIASFGVCLVIDVIITVLGFYQTPENQAIASAIAAFCLMFAFFYAAGLGPLNYVITAEISNAELRDKTTALSFLINVIMGMAFSFLWPWLAQPDGANLGAKTYVVFAGCMFVFSIIVFFALPETKGRSAAEIDAMFARGIPARDWAGYNCVLDPENFAPEKNITSAVCLETIKVDSYV